MLKSYAGKKILLIMEKTTVDFFSVASSIYHHFFFLDPPLVMSHIDPIWLRQPALRLPRIYCLWLSPSVVNLVTLYSAVRLKHHRVRAVSLLGVGLLFPLRHRHSEWWSAWAWWLLPNGGWHSIGFPASTLSVLSPKIPSPVSPQASLAHSAHHVLYAVVQVLPE